MSRLEEKGALQGNGLLDEVPKRGEAMNDSPLIRELNEFRRALEEIRDEQGKVCEIFEVCRHVACMSSYTSWAIADKTLRAEDRI